MNQKFLDAFEEPFIALKYYTLKDSYVPLPDENMKSEKIDLRKVKIPQNIVDIYWYIEGEHDEEDWEFLGKIKYGDSFKYIYFNAWCDYTGFDCQGGIKIYISGSKDKLEKYAVNFDN